jgi:hypothetical protein
MYDDYSLAKALTAAGFIRPARHDAGTSQICDWVSYGLDSTRDGQPLKPDSLYMEAVKA